MKKKTEKVAKAVKVKKGCELKEAVLALQDHVVSLAECVVQGPKTEAIFQAIKTEKEKLS